MAFYFSIQDNWDDIIIKLYLNNIKLLLIQRHVLFYYYCIFNKWIHQFVYQKLYIKNIQSQ